MGEGMDNLMEITPMTVVETADAVTTQAIKEADELLGQQEGFLKRTANFIGRQKTKLCLGATAASVAATLIFEPFDGTKDQIVEAAPYVVGGMAVSEVMWLGGAAMMMGAVGSKIPANPLKLKDKIPEISEKANRSKLFKAGFAVNVVGALGDFVVLSGAVVQNLPPHSWGILGFTLADLGVTLGVRKAMLGGIKKNVKAEEELGDVEA